MTLARRMYRWLQPVLPDAVTGAAIAAYQQRGLPRWDRRSRPWVDTTPIGLGVVGAGTYAQHHFAVLRDLPGVTIRALCTTGSPRAVATAVRFGIARTFSDLDTFLAEPGIDALVVVVPAMHTASVLARCIAARRPILVEKPVALSAAEAERLADAAEAAAIPVMIAMNRRYYSVIEHGLAVLAECGPLRGAVLEIPEDISLRRRIGGFPPAVLDRWMMANSIHALDLLVYLLGVPDEMRPIARSNAGAGNAAAAYGAAMTHPGGAVSTLSALWDTLPHWRLKLVAESGWIEFEPLEQGWFSGPTRRKLRLPVDAVDLRYRPGLFSLYRQFIETVRSNTLPGPPACLLPDAAAVARLIESITAGAV
jgi:predicted dehydrogenase